MPPRQVSLANAGRKLTGPPESYDRKKELQVKRWLAAAAETPAKGEPSEIASVVSEVCPAGLDSFQAKKAALWLMELLCGGL
jgi:hypothetical protein